jgi:hypothetical protein
MLCVLSNLSWIHGHLFAVSPILKAAYGLEFFLSVGRKNYPRQYFMARLGYQVADIEIGLKQVE